MTKKDYKAITKILHKYQPCFMLVDTYRHLVDDLAKVFKDDNNCFSKEKFIEACLSGGY
jgi:folate-dependent tRNA-U54 methylase TrmFO/GidA